MEYIRTVYAKEDDMTFIMLERTGHNQITLSCIGWYFGEPTEENTEKYAHQNTAVFCKY